MKRNAFFFNGEYYLIPDGFESFENFSKFLGTKKSVKINVTKLQEIKCMPPYFVSEVTKDETLVLGNDSLVFSTEIELLSQNEYHERLVEVVKEVCPTCANFIDDGNYDDLNGHHEEVSLDKVCPLKKDKDYKSFYELYIGLIELAKRFKTMKANLEKLVDENKSNEAKEIILDEMKRFMPVPIGLFLEKKKNEYFCYFPNFQNEAFTLVNYIMCKNLNSLEIENWKFINYLPKGVIKDAQNLPLKVFEEVVDISGIEQKILTFAMDNQSIEEFKKAYVFVCNEIGEDTFLNATNSIAVCFENIRSGKEIKFSDLKKKFLKQKINPSLLEIKGGVPAEKSIVSYSADKVPNKIAIYLSDLFFNSFENLGKIFEGNVSANPWGDAFYDMGISIGRLSLKISNSIFDQRLCDKLSKSLTKVMDNNYSYCFARESKQNELNFYFIVIEHMKFLYEVKRHSPIFADFPAEVEIATINEVKKYRADFMFELLEKRQIKN